MWMSTLPDGSKRKGASVRNAAVLPPAAGTGDPVSEALHHTSAATTAIGAINASFIVASKSG